MPTSDEPREWHVTVYFRRNGVLETEERAGFNFRWMVHDGALSVFQYDARHRKVWTHTYLDADDVTAELQYPLPPQ